MHDPGKHSSPVRLPFVSFTVINILLSHTDICYRLTVPRVLCSVCFVWLQTMQAGKVSNYDSEQDQHTERGSRVIRYFSKIVFSFWIFSGTERKTYLCFATNEESFIFLFPGGYSCNTRSFFYTLKERFFRALASPGGFL